LEGRREHSTLSLPAELADLDAVARMPARCIERFGRLDALVNNASSFFATSLGSITPRAWDDLFAANARAPLFLAQAAAPHLRERHGAVLNLLDIHTARPPKGYSVYAMAKAALSTMTEALAVELAPDVRVNGIALGAILWAESGAQDGARQARILQRTPLGRLGDVDDVARAALYLLRDAHYCTGTILRIDGGRALV
ncbi:MAG: SDR family oxidoreductase, partial [Lysobacterales bacterium]